MAHSSVPPGNWLPRASHIQWLVHMGAQKPEPFALIQDGWRLSPISRIPCVVISVAITLQFRFPFCQSCLSHSFPDRWEPFAINQISVLCLFQPKTTAMRKWTQSSLSNLLMFSSVKSYFGSVFIKHFPPWIKQCAYFLLVLLVVHTFMSLFNSSGIRASVMWNLIKSSPPLPSILFTLSTHYGINHLLLHGFWVACVLISQVKSLNILNWELSNLECSRTSKIHM